MTKRVLRICRNLGIKSTIKYSNCGCTVNAANPQHVAENVLDRKFWQNFKQKWLTDVTEFKYYEGIVVHKVYLAYVRFIWPDGLFSTLIRDGNTNRLIILYLDEAVKANPQCPSLFIVTEVINMQ